MMDDKDLNEYHSIGKPISGVINTPMSLVHGTRNMEHGPMM